MLTFFLTGAFFFIFHAGEVSKNGSYSRQLITITNLTNQAQSISGETSQSALSVGVSVVFWGWVYVILFIAQDSEFYSRSSVATYVDLVESTLVLLLWHSTVLLRTVHLESRWGLKMKYQRYGAINTCTSPSHQRGQDASVFVLCGWLGGER